VALFGTVLCSAIFFIFVSYCEVVGFGSTGIRELAKSEAPLHDLALRYASTHAAIALDVAAATSCFAGVIGALAASGRILFALGRAGLSPALARVHPVHGTPAAGVSLAAVLCIVPFVLWAPFVGASNYYSYTSTVGVLALILIYIGVGCAEVVEARREQRPLWPAACSLGPLLLLWVLYCNIYPVPEYPNNLWPYVALIWVILSWGLMRYRPAVASAALPDYS
jgi:amino acid transporter